MQKNKTILQANFFSDLLRVDQPLSPAQWKQVLQVPGTLNTRFKR